MKKELKTSFYISTVIAVLVLAFVILSAIGGTMINFCTSYKVIVRCDESIVIVNERDNTDRQIRNISQESKIECGDVVNFYLLPVKDYNPSVVTILSDNYIS